MVQIKRKKTFIVLLIFVLMGGGLGTYMYTSCKSVLFGSSFDHFPSKRLEKECCRSVNTEGLSDLKSFASGFIYYSDFKKYFEGRYKNLYMISLMNDDIYYFKDRCLFMYGLAYTQKDLGITIPTDKPFKTALIRFMYGTPPTQDLSQIQTERQIIEMLGGHYYLPLKGNDEWLSNQNFMESLIHYFELLPKEALLYIHCIHGRGRTTTVLVLYDIFRNAKKVSLKDIADRHYCLGRENVIDTELHPNGTWSQEGLNARKDLVERFYKYMTAPQGYGHQSWTNWNQVQGTVIPQIIIHR